MSVQNFMSCLAKEDNIANVTIETTNGKRISAVFKDGLPTSESKPGNGSTVTKKGDKSEKNGKKAMSPTRDIAKTLAKLGADKTASTEWTVHYQNKHVAVKYSTVGPIPSIMNGNIPKTNGGSGSGPASLPPKKRAAKAEDGSSEGWNAMSALVDAATVAQRETEKSAAGASDDIAMGAAGFKKKPTKRKPRKIIPEVKEYVEFTQKDVLFGRGGRSNHHPGNKIYREIVTNQQNHYRGCDKNEKTRVAQSIVDQIQLTVGGRFLELDRNAKRWFLVPNVVARRKVGQALRENNTEEARAAKRAKYQGRLSIKKKILGAVGLANGNGSAPMDTADDSAASVDATNGASIKIEVGATLGKADAFPIDEGSQKVEV
mmetsp:Transcript_8504/g.17656  ORF Transcript_8504/g.17656 Transcript_8504/m.17656 type:complete len:374 (+) Transcript_8504:238-1359(+)